MELRGNELAAARTYRERYFIYRFFEAGEGEYELAILHDPLSESAALKEAVYVHLEQAQKTRRFALRGGIWRSGGQ